MQTQIDSSNSQSAFARPVSRRGLFKLLSASVLSSIATAGYARRVEPRWLDVTHVPIPIQGLAPHLQGRRFAQLSDIHLSDFVDPDQLAAAVDVINQIGPDWMMLTGDYVSRNVAYASELIDPLRRLDMPTFAVWGNHDQWTSTTVLSNHFAEATVTVLQNQGLHLDRGLWLAGMDNVWGGRPDLHESLNGRAADDACVLLVHEPDFFDTVLAEDAPVNLQISGHTHGGQVRLPRLSAGAGGLRSWAPVLPRHGVRYPIGHETVGTRHVYTNRGLGVWPVRFRFNCRPELTVFQLEQA